MIKKQIGLFVLVLVVAACSLFGKKDATNSNNASNSNNSSNTGTSTPTDGKATLTLAKYEQIQFGMSYDEVVKILGGPGEEAETYSANSAKVVKYKWAGDNNTRITATFSNDKLSFKTRANLK